MVLQKKILAYRASRLITALVLFFIALVFYQKTNQIEHVVFDSETAIDTTMYKVTDDQIIVKSPILSNAYSYLRPKDLSKTIYTINFSDKPFTKQHNIWIQIQNDIVEISDFDDETLIYQNFGDDTFFIYSYRHKNVSFYTKNVSGENIQFIRNFFLTEILCFLFVFILYEIYNAWRTLRYFHGKRHYYICHHKLWELSAYGFLIVVCIIVIIRFNTIKVVNVSTDHYCMDLSGELFSMYDISCRAFHYDLQKKDIHNGEIVWSSTEIVDFPLMTPKPKTTINTAVFKPDKDGNFKHDFITENLVSKNYQNMRIFILSTLLALFFTQFIRKCISLSLNNK